MSNTSIHPPKPGEHRVVFMGDSITEFWEKLDGSFFQNHPSFINRGISSQTTSQMLVRFQDDVINLHPSVVVILAGTNDIAQNNGPISLEDIFKNIVQMVEMAKANNIGVVLCSLLPAIDYGWRPGLQPAGKIIRLNSMIKSYAAANGIAYVDYHTAMADTELGLDKEYSSDGVHPIAAGYKVMAPLVESAIDETIRKRK